MTERPQPHYDREVLVAVLVYHARTNTSACHCGWGKAAAQLGMSHPEHVADVYEQSVAAVDSAWRRCGRNRWEMRDQPNATVQVDENVILGKIGDEIVSSYVTSGVHEHKIRQVMDAVALAVAKTERP